MTAIPAAHADTLFYGPALGTQSTATGTSANLGVLTLPGTEDFGAFGLPAGAFSDQFNFSLPSTANFGGSAQGMSFSLAGSFPNVGITTSTLGLSLALFQGNGSTFTEVASSNTGALTDMLNGALGSRFYLLVSGTVPSGSVAAFYGGAFQVSAVPEPGTLALILSGFAVVAGVIRRRGAPQAA